MKPRYFTFLGEERPFYFGTNAINLWIRKQASTPDMTGPETTGYMIQIALLEGARQEGIKNAQKFTIQQIFDGIDKIGWDNMTPILKDIESYMPKTAAAQEGGESLGEAPADQ